MRMIAETHNMEKVELRQRIYVLEEQLRNAVSLLRSYGSQLDSVARTIEGVAFPKSAKP